MSGKGSKYLALGMGLLIMVGGICLDVKNNKDNGAGDLGNIMTIGSEPVALYGGEGGEPEETPEDTPADPPAVDPPAGPSGDTSEETRPAPGSDTSGGTSEDTSLDTSGDTNGDESGNLATGTDQQGDGTNPTDQNPAGNTTGNNEGTGAGEGNTGSGETAEGEDDPVLTQSPTDNNSTQVSEADISVDDSNLVYNGSAQLPTVKYNGTTLTKDEDYSISCSGDSQPVNAGRYTAVITMRGNYSSENPIEKSFSIAKGRVNLDEIPKPEVAVEGNIITITNTSNSCQYKIVESGQSDSAEIIMEVSNSGDSIVKDELIDKKTYLISFRAKESDNYEASDWKQISSVTIDLTPKFNPMEVIEIDYKNELIKVKNSSNYELSLSQTSEEGLMAISDLSSVIEKETFDIYVREVKKVSGKTVKSAWLSASIKGRPAKPVVTFTNAKSTTAKDGTITSEQKGLEYKLKTAKAYAELTDKVKLAPGTYVVRIAATEESFASMDEEVIIATGAMATASQKPTANKLTYNGSDQALVAGGETKEGTIKYSTARNGSYSANIPTGKKAGSYSVWWKIEGDDAHKDSNPAVVQVSISKKQVTVGGTVTATKKYDGKTTADVDWTKLKVEGTVGGDSLTVSGKAAFEDANPGTNKTIKVSSLKLAGTGKENYTLKSTTVSGTGTIEPKEEKTKVQNQKKTTTKAKKSSSSKSRRRTNTNANANLESRQEARFRAKLELKERLMESYQADLTPSTYEYEGPDAEIPEYDNPDMRYDVTGSVGDMPNREVMDDYVMNMSDDNVPLAGQADGAPYVVVVIP